MLEFLWRTVWPAKKPESEEILVDQPEEKSAPKKAKSPAGSETKPRNAKSVVPSSKPKKITPAGSEARKPAKTGESGLVKVEPDPYHTRVSKRLWAASEITCDYLFSKLHSVLPSTKFSFGNLSACILVSGYLLPDIMTYPLFIVCRLVLGTLYPAYASYKAVRTKNVREYVSFQDKIDIRVLGKSGICMGVIKPF